MSHTIRYRSGYKYQLVDDYFVKVRVRPEKDISTEFISLSTDGFLRIKRGYAWDGPSGPTFDTKNFMRGSAVHDALYQLMRLEELARRHRKAADLELKLICLQDGMFSFRAWWVHRGVSLAGEKAASPDARKKVHTAP